MAIENAGFTVIGRKMSDPGKSFKYVGIGMGFVALVSGYFFFTHLDVYLFADTVPGEVVDLVKDTCTSSSDDGPSRSYTCYAEVIKYTYDGRDYQYTSTVKSSNPTPVGETTKVYIDPDQPHRPKEVGFWLLFSGIWFLVSTILAVAFTYASRQSSGLSVSARMSQRFNYGTNKLKERLLTSMTPEEKVEIQRLARDESVIEAIKYTRGTLGCGLRVAKEIVEELKADDY